MPNQAKAKRDGVINFDALERCKSNEVDRRTLLHVVIFFGLMEVSTSKMEGKAKEKYRGMHRFPSDFAVDTSINILQWFNQSQVWLKCYYAFFLVCCGCDTSYIVSVHIQCQASIYTLSLCRVHSWQVRLAKQETLTPPGHLVSPLVCRGPWMSTVVLYCWCHSDSASVLLYFTFLSHLFPLPCGAGSAVPREGFDSSVMPFSWCVVAVTLPI